MNMPSSRKTSRVQRRFVALLAIGCVSIFSALAAQERSPLAAGGSRIAGTVVSAATGAPLADARVSITDVKDPRNQRSLLTGDDGKFLFTQVPAGKFSLEGSKRGFQFGAYDQHEQYATAIVTGAGLETEDLTLRLQPSAILSGRLLDESGEAVRGANVTLYRQDHNLGLSRILRFSNNQTDDQGFYEFADLGPGTYFVSASATPWYAIHSANAHQGDDSGDQTTDATADPSLDVAYPTTYYQDVTDPDAALPIPLKGGDHLDVPIHLTPVPALHLRFHTTGSPESGYQVPNLMRPTLDGNDFVQTGGAEMISPGEWEISGVAPGKYLVRVPPQDPASSNWSEMQMDFTSNGEEMDTSQAEPSGEVSARIVMQGGETASTDVSVELLSAKGQPVAGVGVNKQGVAELRNVTPGTYNVMARDVNKVLAVLSLSTDGHASPGHTVTVTTGSTTSVTIRVAASTVNVEGFAEKNGKPTAGVMVVLVPRNPAENRELFRRDQSDLDGSFVLRDVAPGEYSVVAIENGWDLDWSEPGVISYYAKRGQAVTVGVGKEGVERLASQVEVQSK